MIFVLAALGLAIGYGLTLLRAAPSRTRSVFKTAPVAVLAFGCALMWAPPLLTIALALSAIGDAALSRQGERAFLVGLAAFLCGHLAYAPLFWTGTTGGIFWAGAAGFVLFAGGVLRWLWPHLAEMRPHVTVYVAVIALMCVCALTASPLILAGALLFAVSDTVLAAETFVFRDRPRIWTPPVIWSTYIAAQCLIVMGVLT